MAVAIEGFTIVVLLSRIQGRLSDESFEVPNGTAVFDEHLWRCSFMAQADARSYMRYLKEIGLDTQRDANCDAIVIDEFQTLQEQPCEWLRLALWGRAIIAWRAGTEPDKVIAHQGWDPEKGSGLTRVNVNKADHLKFLREENGVEVYLNTDTNTEVFVGRTPTPHEKRYKAAASVIAENSINAGQRPLEGAAAASVAQAVHELKALLGVGFDSWHVLWLLGKGNLSVGNLEKSYAYFHQAHEKEPGSEAVQRELAGVCLELRKFDEAVLVARRACEVSENAETLGNLALAYLMNGDISEAKRSSAAALELNAEDPINQRVRRVIFEVAEGRRDQPKRLRDLAKKARPKKPFWQFW